MNLDSTYRNVFLCSLLLASAGCSDRGPPVARSEPVPDSVVPEPPKGWVPQPIVAASEPARAPDSTAADTTAPGSTAPASSKPDSTRTDSVGADSAPARKKPRPFTLSAADSARWPVAGPEPLPGSLIPEHRIIAYYGTPLSTRMGILGQIPPDEMLPRLEQTATEWAEADPSRKVMPALHFIATVAQPKPGSGQKYRLRMADTLIERVASWAEERGWIMFLDIQIGHSTVAAELTPLLPFLQRPYMHLGLDPEFAMKLGGVPGRRIGTLDAADINHAIGVLGDLVTEHDLPPKVLVVHRFTRRMLTNTDSIALDPRVQVVIDMDGFGAPSLKAGTYRSWIVREPVQYTGFKLFYKNDKPLMTPAQVLELYPQPMYIQYQ